MPKIKRGAIKGLREHTKTDNSQRDNGDDTKPKENITYERALSPVAKCTPELIDKICEYLEGGNYIATACAACGVTESSYRNWMKRAEEELESIAADAAEGKGSESRAFSVYLDFLLRARMAEAKAEIDDIQQIREHKQSWQSRAWIREHRRGKTDWSRPTGASAQPTTNVNILNVTGDDVAKALKAYDVQVSEVKQLDT